MRRSLRFWLYVSAAVLVNCIGIAVVVMRGDQTDVLPTTITPTDGSTAVPGRPTIQITYPHPVDSNSLRAAFRVEPPLKGDLEFDEYGLTYRATQGMRPGLLYSVVLAPGVRDTTGKASRREVRTRLSARPNRLLVLRHDSNPASVWSVDPLDQSAQPVTPTGDDVALLAAAPTGDRLAYVTVAPDRRWSLWSVSLDGGAALPIRSDQDGHIVSLAWSPKGDLLAYEHSQVYDALVSAPRLWLARSDGGDVALMYGRSKETGSRPVWSPDGRRIAFYENAQRAIGVFDFTSRLAAFPSQIEADVSWSPDGDALAFADRGREDGPLSVVIKSVALSDGVPHQLGDAAGIDGTPAWSPAGDWIAFTRMVGTAGGVWLIRPDGTDARLIQQEPGWTYSAPMWAPDGSALSFSRHPIRVGIAAEPELWIAPVAAKPYQLTSGGKVVGWIP